MQISITAEFQKNRYEGSYRKIEEFGNGRRVMTDSGVLGLRSNVNTETLLGNTSTRKLTESGNG